MIRMRYARWLREHGWIVSGVYVVLALLAAAVLSDIDQHHPVESVRVIQTSAAEQLLGAIAAGMIAFTGLTRVTYPAPTWDDLLALAVDEIRMCGSNSLQVVRRLRLLLENLEATVTAERRRAVRDRLDRLDAAIEREIPPADRADARVGDPQGLGLSRLRVEPGRA